MIETDNSLFGLHGDYNKIFSKFGCALLDDQYKEKYIHKLDSLESRLENRRRTIATEDYRKDLDMMIRNIEELKKYAYRLMTTKSVSSSPEKNNVVGGFRKTFTRKSRKCD